MEESEIKAKVKSYINKSIDGLEVESPKIDFKRQWYDLKDKKGVNEFIKDITSIANTYGLNGYIIIGFDEKDKTFHNAKFEDTNLNDSNEIPNMISKHCSDLFDVNTYDFEIDGHYISVIHIPPTLIKPIVILKHKSFDTNGEVKVQKNKILVRKNTSTVEASKYDIELMYYDRKNIIPDYQLETFINKVNFEIENSYKRIFINIAIENSGRKPVSIYDIQGVVELNDGESFAINSPIRFDSNSKIAELKSWNFIVKSNEIINDLVRFKIDDRIQYFTPFQNNWDLDKKIQRIQINYYTTSQKIIKNLSKISK